MVALDKFLLLMKELTGTLELQLPALDKNKEILLVFDDLPVLFHVDEDHSLITLDANLGRSGGRDRLSEILLMASHEWRTRNLWFAICPETETVHLQRVIPLGTYPEFESNLQNFVELFNFHFRYQFWLLGRALSRPRDPPGARFRHTRSG